MSTMTLRRGAVAVVVICAAAFAGQRATWAEEEGPPTIAAVFVEQPPALQGNVEVEDVRFDPVGEGKNAVAVEVKNLTELPQVFGIHIQTKNRPAGWGAQFFDTLAPGEDKWCRFAFRMWGEPDAGSWVRLRFYNPPSAADWTMDNYFQEVKRAGTDLEPRQPEVSPGVPAPPDVTETIVHRLREIQDLLREERYDEVWEAFSLEHRQAGFNGLFDSFKQAMSEEKPRWFWSRDEFLSLAPAAAELSGKAVVLTAHCGDAEWHIDFVEDNGRWQIDWIAGYSRPVILWMNWEQRILPQMQKRATPHFDIYYANGSTAERGIDKIEQARESAYQQIHDFLGLKDDLRIRLVFYENQDVKLRETGHQGMGMAYGTTVVEVYDDTEKCDPFHEMTHILAGSLGDPPAIFSEGFATHMSERLGAPPLGILSGGESSFYERVRQLKKDGQWIPLPELLTYTDIGSEESQPVIAYPEAAAFVRFLIDTYGRDKFLEAYSSLRNTADEDDRRQNLDDLRRIYGKSLPDLDIEWHSVLGLPCEESGTVP